LTTAVTLTGNGKASFGGSEAQKSQMFSQGSTGHLEL